METLGISEKINDLLDTYPKLVERKLKLRKLRDENYFGNCSVCGGNDECLNIGSNHNFVCHKHKKSWSPGCNLFSSWHNENEEIWKKNAKKIYKYDEIDGHEWLDNKIKKLEEEIPEPELESLPF